MAETKMTLLEALAYFKQRMDEVIENGDAPSYKSFDYADNTLKLYKTEDKSDTAAEISFPEEKFLDQTKTKLENSFAWSDAEYPGSTDPSLEGKPVMVLAVKGDTDTTYSFVNLESLMSPVAISAEAGNAIETKADGLYVPDQSVTKEEIDAMFTA